MLSNFIWNSNIKVFWCSNNMQQLSRTFQNPCSLRCMNNRQSWMKIRINPQVFILFNFFLRFSMRFPKNHRFRPLIVVFIGCLSIDIFDQRKFYCSNDQKCFRSKPRDKVRLRCNMEWIIVDMFHWFLWSNQFRPANLSTFRPWRFTSPFPSRNLFCPFRPDFCTMHPLWIRFPFFIFYKIKLFFIKSSLLFSEIIKQLSRRIRSGNKRHDLLSGCFID